jgi:hypothetical protein
MRTIRFPLSSHAQWAPWLLLLACSASHTHDRDASAPPFRIDGGLDAGPIARDSGPIADDAGPPADACERAAAGEPNVACDPATFETCAREVAGVPCCSISFECEAGRVVARDGFCTDDCAQGCPLVTDSFDCAVSGCEWFIGGCGPAPDGVVEGPRCIWPRGDACTSDADCDPSSGTTCVSFWVDPCAGSTCDACGGEARFCSSWISLDGE